MAGKIACDGKGRVENGNQEKHELTPPPLDARHDREVPLLAEAPAARAKKAVLAAAQQASPKAQMVWL